MYQEKNLRHIRLKNGISALKMSRASGISQPCYTKIELSNTNSKNLKKLAAKGFENLIEQHKKSVLELEADIKGYTARMWRLHELEQSAECKEMIADDNSCPHR